jgi:tripartite-type tricarboxylate transporter receptor subunit TctC
MEEAVPNPNLRSAAAVSALAVCLALASAPAAQALDFPTRPIRIIVPFGAGGSNDITTRALAKLTERHLGRPIIIENLTGGGGVVGANAIVNAPPEGYTIGTSVPSMLIAPYLKKASYDAANDFTYIIGVMGFTYGVVVRKDAPWNTFEEFLADARRNPGKISYGTPGVGTFQHITMERIAKLQGIRWVTVPFRGDPDALNSLMGGNIDAVATTSSWGPQVDAGNLRLLVTWGAERAKSWPAVPTLREAGVDIVVNAPYGLAGPKGMDPKVVKTLHDAFKTGMADPAFMATLARLNEEPFYLDSDSYRNFVSERIGEWRKAIEEVGARLE